MKLSALFGFALFAILFWFIMPNIKLQGYPSEYAWFFALFPTLIIIIALIKLIRS